MATSKKEIKEWLMKAKERPHATHVIIMCDTFSWEDYPAIIYSTDDVSKKVADYDGKNMQKVMEVYNLDMPLDEQLNSHRAYNL